MEVNKVVKIDVDESEMVTTTKGPMLKKDLRQVLETIDNDNEHTNVIEYYLEDELVHRSVHVQLKKNVVAEAFAATF